eukprot:CAMPEP_0173466190 /NCGR_PEP_ID=MMETSP1357-20121228/72932_1 /TAXON_ID=77926 /ORGANISM="Hemiselmis rufescens, Strain PCC563" /LENGTH=79 /DNA_ID=CAMNT_0014434223 /DNA_START=59 /DNA_END=296 /DNA_ORIENTATION=+
MEELLLQEVYQCPQRRQPAEPLPSVLGMQPVGSIWEQEGSCGALSSTQKVGEMDVLHVYKAGAEDGSRAKQDPPREAQG